MVSLFAIIACTSSSPNVSEGPGAQPSTQEKQVSETPYEELVRHFSMRHQKVTCSDLQDDNPDFPIHLSRIITDVPLPPWAGMRAAQCMIELYPEQHEAELTRWMQNQKTKGLAVLLAGQIDSLPPHVGLRIASAGMDGPHHQVVQERLTRSQNSKIRALIRQ